MIVTILFSLFPVVSVLPLFFVLLSYQKESKSNQYFYLLFILTFLYFILEGFSFLFLQFFENRSLFIRVADSFFLFLFLLWAVRNEKLKEADLENFSGNVSIRKNPKIYLRSAFLMFIVSSVFQIYFLKKAEPIFFASLLSAIVLAFYYDRAYIRVSYYPQIRSRLVFYFWILSLFLLLPVFRFILLAQIGYSFYRFYKQKETFKENKIRLYHHERLKTHQIIESMTETLHDFSDLRNSLTHFLRSLCEGIEAKAAAVYIWDEKNNCYHCIQTLGYFFPLIHGNEMNFTHKESLQEIALSQKISDSDNLVWECGTKREGIFIPYAAQDSRISSLGTRASNVQTLLLEPLVFDEELLGVLVIENKLYERYFSESDVYLVKNFSHYCSIILKANRSALEKQNQAMAQIELQLGIKIQSRLLPSEIPIFPGLELAGSMSPAKEIGGDYYDFIHLGANRLGIVIGDVSGKGVPAGMVMTNLQALLHAECRHYTNTCQTLIQINEQLAPRIADEGMFVSLLFFEWNANEKKLRFTSCGHEHILHYRAFENRLETIRSGGVALAMVEDNSKLIREHQLPVSSGDTILLYTDGVTETVNMNNEMFGLERLKTFLEHHQGLSPKMIQAELLEKLQVFSGGAPQLDDITLIVMRF